jgi:hypothetical protein
MNNRTIPADSKLLCYQRSGKNGLVADPCNRDNGGHMFDHVMGLCRAESDQATMTRVSWGHDDDGFIPMVRMTLGDTAYYLMPDCYSHEQIQAALLEKQDA